MKVVAYFRSMAARFSHRAQTETDLEEELRLHIKFFLTFDGQRTQPDTPSLVERSRVAPEYFQLLGIRLLRGRLFNEFDTDTASQVAIVDEAFAHTYWPSEDGIGKRLNQRALIHPGLLWWA
jgi:hypothetical protein